MNSTSINVKRALAGRALDLVEDMPPAWSATRIELQESADGSGRWMATIELQDDAGSEATEIIVAPAPEDAPAWALRCWTYNHDAGVAGL